MSTHPTLTPITLIEAKTLRGTLKNHVAQLHTSAFIKTCDLLYRVQNSCIRTQDGDQPMWQYWGFPSFQHYAETELGIARSRSLQMSKVWQVFGISVQDPAILNKIHGLGSGKILVLAKILSMMSSLNQNNKSNLGALNLTKKDLFSTISSAKTESVSDLDRRYKELRQVFSDTQKDQPKPSLYDFHCKVSTNELAIIEKAIKDGKLLEKGTRKGEILATICKEWVLKAGKKTSIKLSAKKSLKTQDKAERLLQV